MLYGIGAAIVILGALFKIQHWEGGSLLLTIGMVTEAVVFTYSAFDKKTENGFFTIFSGFFKWWKK